MMNLKKTEINIAKVKDPRKGIKLINHYEEIIKTQRKRVLDMSQCRENTEKSQRKIKLF